MNHLLNLVKLASSFPKEINLGFPNSCVLSSHLSFPRARNLELLCPLFMLAFPQARLFFPRTNFGSFDGLLKKVRFYGQLTQKNTYSTKSQSTAKPNNVPFSWHIYTIFWYSLSWKKNWIGPFSKRNLYMLLSTVSVMHVYVAEKFFFNNFFYMNYDMAFRREGLKIWNFVQTCKEDCDILPTDWSNLNVSSNQMLLTVLKTWIDFV